MVTAIYIYIRIKQGSLKYFLQRHLYEPFNLPGLSRFLNDVSVTLINKTGPKDPTKQEDYWIQTLKTKTPLGLNVEYGL